MIIHNGIKKICLMNFVLAPSDRNFLLRYYSLLLLEESIAGCNRAYRTNLLIVQSIRYAMANFNTTTMRERRNTIKTQFSKYLE